MSFVSQDCALSLLATILLLLLTSQSSCASKKTHTHVNSVDFLSQKFEVEPGHVANMFYYDIEFPKGHIGIKSVKAEIVDEAGKSIPLYEAYVHHYIITKYHQRKKVVQNTTALPNRWIFPHKDYVLKRNSGMCQKEVISHFFGLGSESRGTRTEIPDPYAIEVGNPKEIPQGFEEKWMINIQIIDLRGVKDEKGCMDCRCNLYNVTHNEEGLPLPPTYKGGFLCCYHNTKCQLKEGFEGAKRSLHLKYTVKWVEWDHSVLPLEVYVFDVTDSVQVSSNGEKGPRFNHNCLVEYEIESCNNITTHKDDDDDGCLHVKKTRIPFENDGYVIYGGAHLHFGGVNATLYGQDGRVICSSKPEYGTGEEVGNEKGFLVGMTTCYPNPGSVKVVDGETLTLESVYVGNTSRTGLMNDFTLLDLDAIGCKSLQDKRGLFNLFLSTARVTSGFLTG
ncbi:stress up-regulated Nod 19 protein [Senna tora]|uniref:Stress up-regulated Nod 19 protein n=1 Tax=Senna tora TaxID=362788 RepID=A0A834XBP9_9FABA|nr:stress up-regulated Nod 19 protein [Senna tora]